MLSRVEVRSPQGDILVLSLDDDVTGLLVEDIQGLDPVKATLVSSSFAQQDGAQYHSARREPRNITFRLGLEPDPSSDTTVRDLRNQVYSFFMPKREVFLSFYMNDDSLFEISGRVETCETAMFTQDPAVDISIMCFDPDFTAEGTTFTLEGATVADTSQEDLDYIGTVETGFKFTLMLNRTLSSFTIYQQLPDDSFFQMDFAASLLSGDVLVINTAAGSKGATLTRTGASTSVLYGISPQSKWLELEPGLNKFRVYAVGAAIPYEIEYSLRYGGI